MKQNNRGQVLVLFLLLLPFFFILGSLIIDYGFILLKTKEVNHTMDDVVSYVEQSEEEKLEEKVRFFLKKNINDIKILEVEKENEEIKIYMVVQIKGIFLPHIRSDIREMVVEKKIPYKKGVN